MVNMIVAVSKNNCIGVDNHMPWHEPRDLAYFKEKTLNKPIIMGRKTFESIGRPLPGRENLVLTRDPGYRQEGVQVFHKVEDVLESIGEQEVFIIGGGEIYRFFEKYADTLYITIVDIEAQGDTFFIDYKKDFDLIKEETVQGINTLHFTKWKRKDR